MAKIEIGQKCYSVYKGMLFTYKRVVKKGLAPQSDCDILLLDENGHIHSAKSENYHLDKYDALRSAHLEQSKTVNYALERFNRESEILKKIVELRKQHEPQEETAPTLEEWLDQWEAAVLDGQSSISREEAIRRYEKEHG